jgi:hypothetical protein
MIDPITLDTVLASYRKLYGSSAPSRVQLGEVCITQGAAAGVDQDRVLECLARHQGGDWGWVDEEDKDANERALREGTRLLSAWPIDPKEPLRGSSNLFWIITEHHRQSTTLLLPSEY